MMLLWKEINYVAPEFMIAFLKFGLCLYCMIGILPNFHALKNNDISEMIMIKLKKSQNKLYLGNIVIIIYFFEII